MIQSLIPFPVNISKWSYETASSGGLAIMLATGTGGSITLKDPNGKFENFRYGGLGAGIGFGLRVPRFGTVDLAINGKSVGGAGATEGFDSTGKLFVADSIADRDLTRDDITGACAFMEISGGIVVGLSGTIILFGLDPKLLALTIMVSASPVAAAFSRAALQRRLLQSAKGVLLMGGLNAGTQVGASGAIYLGALF